MILISYPNLFYPLGMTAEEATDDYLDRTLSQHLSNDTDILP